MRGAFAARFALAVCCALSAIACGGEDKTEDSAEVSSAGSQEKPVGTLADTKTAHIENAPAAADAAAAGEDAGAAAGESIAPPLEGLDVAAITQGHGFAACAACHLPTGAGVPGAFPPLAENVVDFASTPKGREYLAIALRKGIIGAIDVGGQTYRGAMPAQYPLLDDEKAAATLNYVLYELNDAAAAGVAPFTGAEIASYGAKHADAKAADLRSIAAAN